MAEGNNSEDVMPYYEVGELKKQMKKLQDNKDSVSSEQLMNSMNGLVKGMDSMLQLFKTAADEMKIEEQEEGALAQQVKPLMDKIDEIIEQNKIIAEGMVAIADLVKERLPEKPLEPEQKFPRMPPQMMQQQMMPPPQMQRMPQQPNVFPGPTMQPNVSLSQFDAPPPMDMPPGMDMPPPPSPNQKRGMFKR